MPSAWVPMAIGAAAIPELLGRLLRSHEAISARQFLRHKLRVRTEPPISKGQVQRSPDDNRHQRTCGGISDTPWCSEGIHPDV